MLTKLGYHLKDKVESREKALKKQLKNMVQAKLSKKLTMLEFSVNLIKLNIINIPET